MDKSSDNKVTMKVSGTRYHDISCGHRVAGHEGKCRFLHGHNYRIYWTWTAPRLDAVGRTIDFGVIKTILCQWLEDNWDHKMLLWEDDPIRSILAHTEDDELAVAAQFVSLPFNPTAENMAVYLLQLGDILLKSFDMSITLDCVTVWETRKCSATATREK